jgi:hypothetical protein
MRAGLPFRILRFCTICAGFSDFFDFLYREYKVEKMTYFFTATTSQRLSMPAMNIVERKKPLPSTSFHQLIENVTKIEHMF